MKHWDLYRQCDQLAGLFVLYLAIANNEIMPNMQKQIDKVPKFESFFPRPLFLYFSSFQHSRH